VNLNVLDLVQTQKQQLAEKRIQKAQENFERAKQCVSQALATGFHDKSLLLEASQALFFSIQTNRTDPEPLVLMAYLFLLLEDHKRALLYLKRALELNPHHQDALQLMDYLLHPPQVVEADSDLPDLPDLPDLSNTDDLDALYEQCHASLMAIVRGLMQEAQPQFVLNAIELRDLTQRYEHLNQTYQGLQKSIEHIDQEIDTSELEKMLGPLRHFLKRLASVVRDSEMGTAILTEMKQLHTQWSALLSPAGQSEALAQDLDLWLDRCDQFADQIDAFEQQGYSVGPLVQVYEKMVQVLEDYQDSL